jgi:hypothetical protein
VRGQDVGLGKDYFRTKIQICPAKFHTRKSVVNSLGMALSLLEKQSQINIIISNKIVGRVRVYKEVFNHYM